MNRTCFRFVLAAALVALALPAAAARPQQAPDKSYGVEFLLPETAPDGTANPAYTNVGTDGQTQLSFPVFVTVYVKNESPPSTAASNAGSLKFSLSGLVVVEAPTCPRAVCAVDGDTVYVTNISPPIQAKEAYPVTLRVNSCVVLGEAFIHDVVVSTGSQLNGNPFMQFTGDAAFPNKPILTARKPYPYNFNVAPTSVATTGISCGKAACDLQALVVPNQFTTNPTSFMTVVRGNNADATCSPGDTVDYAVTNNLWTSDPRLHAAWSASVNPVFAYKLTRQTTTQPWAVGWLPKPGLADTITAPSCFGPAFGAEPAINQLPFPALLGILSQDLKVNGDKIKVDTGSSPPPAITPPGLPIRIDNEWMLVTAVGSTSWDVTRINRQLHSAGANVATTPMQLLSGVSSPYSNNSPAQMCQVWQSTDGKSAWFMDGSDGWVLGR